MTPLDELNHLLAPYRRTEHVSTRILTDAQIDLAERLQKDAVYRASELRTHEIGWQHFMLPRVDREDGTTELTAEVVVLTPAAVARIKELFDEARV